MTVVIRDPAGNQIASVQLSPKSDDNAIVVERVMEGRGRLLNYYFGKGMRQVTVESEVFLLPGVLKTHWAKNERKWRVLMNSTSSEAIAELAAAERV